MLDTITHGEVRELRLARPPANALDPELVGRLLAAVRDAAADETEAVILSGAPGMFSAGLDIPHLLGLEGDELRDMWRNYLELVRTLALSPIPVVAALTGHSPAGGAVLALFCDQRIMAEGDYRIGLNEVEVGMAVPPQIVAALARVVGQRQAERLAVRGLMVSGVEARALGLVDRLAPVEEVVGEALAWCRGVMALPRRAMLETRLTARSDLHAIFADELDPLVELMMERWESDETRAAVGRLAERLSGS